jgi:hypothetical protein
MSVIDKLRNMNLDHDAEVSLSLSEGTDVFVHNETEVETALQETDVVSTFAELIATSGLTVTTRYGTNVIESLRESGLLDDYERGSFEFSEYLTETINDNFYDVDLIEYSTEKYDHKRGFCTLSADVKVSAKELFDTSPYLGGWDVTVQTENGTLKLDK